MSATFIHPKLKQAPFRSGKIIVSTFILLAIILVISAILDIVASRRELSHILAQQANSLATAIETSGENAVDSYDLVQRLTAERMLSIARLLEQMDADGMLSERSLATIAEENKVFRINVFDEQGKKVMASFWGRGPGSRSNAPKSLLSAILDGATEELVLGLKQSRMGLSQRFAVAKKRRKGGVIVLNIDPSEMLSFRRSIGLGSLLQNIAKTSGIAYIAIQDSSGIITATANVDSLSTPAFDTFLLKPLQSGETAQRFTSYKGQPILEIVRSFGNNPGEIIRLAMITSHIAEAQRAAVIRTILSSLLLLIFGGVAGSSLINAQNIRTLQSAYDQIETYTGSLLKNMNDAVIAVDRSGRISLVNPAAEEMFGVRSEHILGAECAHKISAICPYIKESLQSGRGKNYFDEKMQTPGGERTLHINVNVVMGQEAKIEAVFAVIKDISELKKLEANLKRQEKITAMGHLAAGVAHEIRNPLNAIAMIAQRLRSEFKPTENQQEFQELATTVVTESRRIDDIIQHFLQFARPGELNPKMISLEQLLNHVQTLLQPEARQHGITFSVSCERDIHLTADEDKLKQALINLGKNAIEACDRDGHVRIQGYQSDEGIFIEVSDDGKGIPEAEQDKIFNLYYTTRAEGSGIGLSIVQQIVSQHRGALSVMSKEGKGTVFTITLPKTSEK